ncbi:MAG: hypothetical protein WBI14_00730, partial [Anaerolineaceae bacterium]
MNSDGIDLPPKGTTPKSNLPGVIPVVKTLLLAAILIQLVSCQSNPQDNLSTSVTSTVTLTATRTATPLPPTNTPTATPTSTDTPTITPTPTQDGPLPY